MEVSCLEWPRGALHSCFEVNRQLLQQFEYGHPGRRAHRGPRARHPSLYFGGDRSGRPILVIGGLAEAEEQYRESSNVEFRTKPMQPMVLIELVEPKGRVVGEGFTQSYSTSLGCPS